MIRILSGALYMNLGDPPCLAMRANVLTVLGSISRLAASYMIHLCGRRLSLNRKKIPCSFRNCSLCLSSASRSSCIMGMIPLLSDGECSTWDGEIIEGAGNLEILQILYTFWVFMYPNTKYLKRSCDTPNIVSHPRFSNASLPSLTGNQQVPRPPPDARPLTAQNEKTRECGLFHFVPRGGLEPPTLCSSDKCSTN